MVVADRLIVIEHGRRIVQSGTPAAIAQRRPPGTPRDSSG
jgi:ABC-type multidrug transport system fused ATPase/permease subunit